MTTEILSAGIKVGEVSAPLGPLDDVLADLRARLAVGERIAAEAEAARDWGKLRRALEKVHLRTQQIGWLQQRPANARCWKCGELEDGRSLSVECVAHRSTWLAERARVLAARDVEDCDAGE
jgi:hypothetical protein